ncbi:hypothetical protein PT974_10791 [Cladobotryum mycophilum]|uniref:Uncharacterized protein n=1 Tax=Cladobotryum mycophilum TaxID=491253 RepID=A0ABR0SBR6_9HYPO
MPPATPEEKRFWNGARPRPKEFFPYTARIRRATGFGDVPMQFLFDLFAEYEPTAVYLPDLGTLQDPERRVNGTEAGDGGVWTVVSDYDPAVVPARGWEELRSNQTLELQAKASERREQRRLKRETQDETMVELSGDLFGGEWS